MLRITQVLLLLTFCFIANAQYINTVTIPDKSKAVSVDPFDLSVRYAKSIEASTMRDHLRILASDSLEGRETGQKGMEMAAEYLSKNLKNLGLSSGMEDKSYIQPVAFTFSKWFDLDIYVNKEWFRQLKDFVAFPDRNETNHIIQTNEVVFLGYGIDDPKYSDYKKAKVKDKVIMINRGEPIDKNGKSYITKTDSLSSWSDADMQKKLIAAKAHGVKCVLIIENDMIKMIEENRRRLSWGTMALGNHVNDVPKGANHAYVSSTLAKAIIGKYEEKILKARKKLEKGKPANVKLETELIINMTKQVSVVEGKNVVGFVEGKSKKDEYIVVTAHYDHLGKRGEEVFNGADDNGSGSTALLELAQAYQQASMEGNGPERSVVFTWFCGEEKGLLGSEYYTENPVFPMANTVANVNIDMIGRVDEKYKDNPDYIYVIGSDRLSSDLHKINEEVNQKYSKLSLDYTYNGEEDPNRYYYRSDHYNFAKRGIPSIFYFSGVHEDYHRPTDTVDKINFEKMTNVSKLIFHTIWELANRPERIVVDGQIK